MSELLPCPWCQTTRLHLDAFGTAGETDADLRPTDWRVMHDEGQEPKCEAWGPECDTREQALAAWNRRAPSADHVPDAGKMVAPPVVKDCLTTQAAFAAGAAEMRERAAEQVDCGCSWRADALAATNKGERFVACGNDPCGAIEARAIRALPLPAGGSGWRPIETAPIDQEIDVWVARSEDGHAYSHGYRQERVVWNATDQYWEGERTAILPRQVTHWQPLPAAPEEGG